MPHNWRTEWVTKSLRNSWWPNHLRRWNTLTWVLSWLRSKSECCSLLITHSENADSKYTFTLMVDFSVASRNCVPYLVPISEACDPTVPWPNSYHWRNPVSDLIRAKWRNSLGMCLLSGYHLVIWERIYLTEWGVGRCCYVFPVFGNDALVEVDVYIHTELFIIFSAMVSTPPQKKHTQFTLGLYFGCQTPKSEQIENTSSAEKTVTMFSCRQAFRIANSRKNSSTILWSNSCFLMRFRAAGVSSTIRVPAKTIPVAPVASQSLQAKTLSQLESSAAAFFESTLTGCLHARCLQTVLIWKTPPMKVSHLLHHDVEVNIYLITM